MVLGSRLTLALALGLGLEGGGVVVGVAPLALVQLRAEKAARTFVEKSKPSNQDELWNTLDTHAVTLGETLKADEGDLTSERMQMNAANTAVLSKQKSQNHNLFGSNEQERKAIASMQEENAHLREKAMWFKALNDGLVADISALRANLSTASKFIDKALYEGRQLTNAAEVEVLAALAKQDSKEAETKLHEARMREVTGASLLQLSSHGVDPKRAIEDMMASVSRLAEEKAATDARLQAVFEAEYQEGEERHKGLLEEESNLHVARDTTRSLTVRLRAALEMLTKTHEILLDKSHGLRLAAEKLGHADETARIELYAMKRADDLSKIKASLVEGARNTVGRSLKGAQRKGAKVMQTATAVAQASAHKAASAVVGAKDMSSVLRAGAKAPAVANVSAAAKAPAAV